MIALSPSAWVVLAFAAFFVGISKTALPGLATLSVAMCAAVLPAKESTAAMLLILLVGDLVAIWTYRHAADWETLRRLMPPVVVGVVCGAVFLHLANDRVMRFSIGWILLALTALTLILRVRASRHNVAHDPLSSRPAASSSAHLMARIGYGSLGGFTTMAANAGGPIMSLYFLWSRLPIVTFLGTTAWFFFLVNLVKLPFSAAIGLVDTRLLLLASVLAPLVLLGAFLGRVLVAHMTQQIFEPLIIVLTILSSVYLVW
ncbi:MAG: sulfite exporter TauE/SafE family protein [Actinomycetaceae bacterium]|nr:sulfite exporter TauE/SafE family protein [Actinomycetaceae bacterium]